jgi:hypothetical protein
MAHRVIYLQPGAPPKPEAGAPCNGCGLCCAWQPCPLGMLVSRRRSGACAALAWSPPEQRYHCAMLSAPHQVWPRLGRWAAPLIKRLARRWIAAGLGCDCQAEVAAG